MSANKKTVAVIIIIVIMLSIVAIFIFAVIEIKKLVDNVLLTNKISIAEYCANLPPTQYVHTISRPAQENKYNYELAQALIDVSFEITQSNCYTKRAPLMPLDFYYYYEIYAPDSSRKHMRMYCVVFMNKEYTKMLIAFTGTFFLDEWKYDFTYPLVEATQLNGYEPGIKVHKGFYEIYLSVRDSIWKLYSAHADTIEDVYITGHSLGGAISTIAAFDFAATMPIHYSFAAPRSGNVAYAQKFNKLVPNSMRISNIEDAIPHLPPAVFIENNLYGHTNNPIPFNANLGTIYKNHIDAYQKYLPKS